MKQNNLLYIAGFLVSVLIIQSVAGTQATYFYLLIVLLSVIFTISNKYKISVDTPDILK